MKRTVLYLFCIFFTSLNAHLYDYYNLKDFNQEIVVKNIHIDIPDISYGFNPTMVEYDGKILMAFRHQSDIKMPWLSQICVTLLDKEFNICSDVQVLNIRKKTAEIPYRMEDPRLFCFQGKIYLMYNDNLEKCFTAPPGSKRDMYLVELIPTEEGFSCSEPLLLKHPTNFPHHVMEKNWTPFEYEGEFLIAYTIQPLEVLRLDLISGECELVSKTRFLEDNNQYESFPWQFLSGSTSAIKCGNVYLSFFHSFNLIFSNVSKYKKIPHYFCGAYTFSAEPPFRVLKISPYPIVGKDFYTVCSYHKRVVYPGGYLLDGDFLHMCYGKDDRYIYMATFDTKKLLDSLKDVESIMELDNQ